MAEAISAAEASAHFFNALDPEKAMAERPVVERFIQHVGPETPMQDIDGSVIAAFAEAELQGLDRSSEEDILHLEPVRAFLAYCSRLAFSKENLVPYLQLGVGGGGARGGEGAVEELGGNAFFITIEGLQALERELETLKARRPQIAEDLRAAMADKDFRENAPLDAARDAQAHLEARIRTIEDQLRRAVIMDAAAKRGRANVGSTIRVHNERLGREQTFHLVSANEVDPTNGKISVESPVGRAVINHLPGDEVEVDAPGGKITLRLIEVDG